MGSDSVICQHKGFVHSTAFRFLIPRSDAVGLRQIACDTYMYVFLVESLFMIARMDGYWPLR